MRAMTWFITGTSRGLGQAPPGIVTADNESRLAARRESRPATMALARW